MIEQLAQDTPIIRAKLSSLPTEQIQDLVTKLQEKRMRAQTIYEEAKALKQDASLRKQAEALEDTLEKFEKKHATVVKGIEALDKYAKEILGLRLALGL